MIKVIRTVAELVAAHATSEAVLALRASLAKSSGSAIGVILYHGPSMLDGAPIVAIATGFAGSANPKTGDMVQTFILRADITPVEAARIGADVSICGMCEHRPILAKETGAARCYVTLMHGPRSVFEAFQRGRYDDVTQWDGEAIGALGAGHFIRLGTYGDPAAIPAHIWHAFTSRARGRTGYTHQAASEVGQGLKGLCMASADNETQAEQFRADGWRTFRVAPAVGWHKMQGEGLCPASEEAGKVATCQTCGLCSGASGKGKASIVIPDHSTAGNGAKRRAKKVAA